MGDDSDSSVDVSSDDNLSPSSPSSSSVSDSSASLGDGCRENRAPTPTAQPLLQNTMGWKAALDILTGADAHDYPARPVYLRAKATRQVFVERPPKRRVGGGDKWRNSGGRKGGVERWIDDRHGVRKRYGRVNREGGRPSLKFMRFTLLKRPGKDRPAREDPTVSLYTVDAYGTEDEPEVPDSDWQSPPSLAFATRSSGTPRSIDLAAGRFANVLHGKSRKLPGGGGGSHTAESMRRQGPTTWRRGGATVDMNAVMLANPEFLSNGPTSVSQLDPGTPRRLGDTWQQESDTLATHDWIYQLDHMESASNSDEASIDGSAEGGSTGSSTTLHIETPTGADECNSVESAVHSSTSPTEVGWTQSPEFLQFDQADDFSAFGYRWDSTSDSSSPQPDDIWLGSENVEQQRSWTGLPATTNGTGLGSDNAEQQFPWTDSPAATHGHSASGRKRKEADLVVPQINTKRRAGQTAAFAMGLGLCMIVISRLLPPEPDIEPSKNDGHGMCEQGPVSVSGADHTDLCSAAPEGSICPYECSPGLRRDGLHACTRAPSGHFSYSGGACVPFSPCADGVSLFDDGALNLAPDLPRRRCTWDLFCTNTSLSPILRFENFAVRHGNLSIHDVPPLSDQIGQLWAGSYNEQMIESDAAAPSPRLGQRRRLKLPPEDITILHGVDPWWVSQPMSFSQSRAKVVYNSDFTGQDYFKASFTCGSFVEQCTATDEMELDWVSLQHPDRPQAKYPAWLSVPPRALESISDWSPPLEGEDCASELCAHGVCIDSASSQGAFSSETAFSFVCDCQPGWSGDQCDLLRRGDVQSCKADENDCDATTSTCEAVGPGQHECACFPGYTASRNRTCELIVEDPPVGPAWQHGPGYEASEHVVRGTFRARIGESPKYLHSSSLSKSVFFDPASYNQMLLAAPNVPDGCTVLAYNGTLNNLQDKVVLVSGDGPCDFGVKVMIAQDVGAAGVIIYGDDIPAGSQIDWAIADPSKIDPFYAGSGMTAEQLGLTIDIPAIITTESQGLVLRRALLSGLTWVELHCGSIQHLNNNRVLPEPPSPPPPPSPAVGNQACTSSPCINGASCAPFAEPDRPHRSGTAYTYSEYTCTCASGFYGEHCEFTQHGEPSPAPVPDSARCKDNSLWHSLANGYSCMAYQGTGQQWCTTDLGTTRLTPISTAGGNTSSEDPELYYAYEACPLSCGNCPR